MTRLLFLIHRYLGIALGLLMVVWCVSGIVMMYVPYPTLSREARMAGLEPLSNAACCAIPAEQAPGGGDIVSRFEIEALNGSTILSVSMENGRAYSLDLEAGSGLDGQAAEEALEVAARFARSQGLSAAPTLLGEVESDQWTTGRFRGDRPLYHFALNDADGTELYVSSTSGRALQVTNSSERFWNWFGAIPHWLYFSQLRENPALWTEIVVWTSAIGSALTLIGIYIGITQVKRRRSTGRLASPYRGLWYWHHVPGLVFGLFTLTWVFSGLLSMTPFDWFGNSDPSAPIARLQGEAPAWSEVREAIAQLIAAAPEGTVHLDSAPMGGAIFAIATLADGTRLRLGADGAPSALDDADYAAIAARIGEGFTSVSWDMLNEEDAYYYGRAHIFPPLPVLRVMTEGENAARFYLDPVSGRLMNYADAEGRLYRWLYAGLHSLDFTSAFRARPFWDVLMIVLLLGATGVCATGTWLGIRRLLGRSKGQGFLGERK
jgi:hypothetical protein